MFRVNVLSEERPMSSNELLIALDDNNDLQGVIVRKFYITVCNN